MNCDIHESYCYTHQVWVEDDAELAKHRRQLAVDRQYEAETAIPLPALPTPTWPPTAESVAAAFGEAGIATWNDYYGSRYES